MQKLGEVCSLLVPHKAPRRRVGSAPQTRVEELRTSRITPAKLLWTDSRLRGASCRTLATCKALLATRRGVGKRGADPIGGFGTMFHTRSFFHTRRCSAGDP